uniref:Secreted protein n=1 Tax=Electrophorus electricus TaxID=8005 RepID=A0AAY5EXP6_ELEEL
MFPVPCAAGLLLRWTVPSLHCCVPPEALSCRTAVGGDFDVSVKVLRRYMHICLFFSSVSA